jgi:hypothetical protein
VIIYLNENFWAEQLQGTPRILIAKKLEQLNVEFTRQGFRATAGDADWIAVDTSGQSLLSAIGFLERCGAAAVTVEPADVVNFLGRNLGALTLRRGIENNGPEVYDLELIEPSQLADNLTKAAWAVSNHTAASDENPYSTPELDEAIAVDDLTEHGLITPEMQAAQEWYDREPEQSGGGTDSFGNPLDREVPDDWFGTSDPWGN